MSDKKEKKEKKEMEKKAKEDEKKAKEEEKKSRELAKLQRSSVRANSQMNMKKTMQTGPTSPRPMTKTSSSVSVPNFSSSLNPVMKSSYGNKWNLCIKSDVHQFSAWIEPDWSIDRVKQSILKKCPQEMDSFILFFDNDSKWLSLDPDSVVSSFSQIKAGATLWLKPPTFSGEGKKVVEAAEGNQKAKADSNALPTPFNSPPNLSSPNGHDSKRLTLSPSNQNLNIKPFSDTNTNNIPQTPRGNLDTSERSPIPEEKREKAIVKTDSMGGGSSFIASPPIPARDRASYVPTMTRYGTVRTYEDQVKLDRFFEMLVKCSREILSDVKDVKSMLNESVSEEELFEAAKNAAQKAVNMNTIVFRAVTIARADPDQYEFVKDASKATRAKVLELIESAREVAANRFDFLLQQTFSNNCREVVDSIKNLLVAADQLQSNDLTKAKEDERVASKLITHSTELKSILKQLSNSVFRRETQDFISMAKRLILAMNELLEVEQSLKLDKYWQMKSVTQNLIAVSKMAVNSQQPFTSFQTARTQLTDTLHSFIQDANAKSVEVRKAVKKGQIADFGPKVRDPLMEKDYRLKKSAAMKLTNMLTVKFEMFYRQWTQQTPEDAEELYDLMVEEMGKHFLHYVAEKEREEMEKKEKEREAQIAKIRAATAPEPVVATATTTTAVVVAAPTEEDSEEDKEAMKELAKIMKMKNASDWQEMALNLGRLKARMDVSKRTTDLEVEKEIDVERIEMELDKGSRDLKGTFIEFLLTLSDIVLNSEDSGKGQKLDEKSELLLVKSVENLFRILRRTCVICKAWIKPRSGGIKKESTTTQKKIGNVWTIPVECTEQKITYTKRIKLDTSLDPKAAIAKILEKIPVKTNENHGLFIPNDKIWIKEDKIIEDYPQLSNGKSVLQLRIKESAGDKQKGSMDLMLDQIIHSITTASSRGQVQKNVINALTNANGEQAGNYAAVKAQLEGDLQERIFSESNAVRVLGIQIISSLQLLNRLAANSRDGTGLLQIIATCRQVVSVIAQLLGAFETYYNIHVHESSDNSANSSTLQSTQMMIGDWQAGSNAFWSSNYASPKLVGDEKMRGGTIDQIVWQLANFNDVVSLSTFLVTYQSFTTPFVFLQKLVQCYAVPERADKEKVRGKIMTILRDWITQHFEDFDQKTLSTLKAFVDYVLDSEHREAIKEELAKKMEESKEKKKSKLVELVEMKVPEEELTPADLLMLLNESEIARQLTLIEFKIFAKIKSSELLNQSWNKEKLQHRAPNILSLISRANKLSFWVASFILWFPKVADRTKVVTKLINIGQHMLQLGNFNTLMGLLAGLNVSAVSRLKHTWAGLPPTLKETYTNLQAVFSPAASFKRYRQELALAKPKGAVLPYLGSYLKDLTFAEDGNRDFIDEETKVINWTKRELLGKIIMEVQQFQQKPYAFPVVEPIHTFLTELPHLEDNDLYDLSFIREPKGSDIANIE